MTFARIAAFVAALSLVAACQKAELEPPVPMGNFVLGYNIVVTDKMQKLPISREATGPEWEASLKQAIADRFGRYGDTGSKLYHLGIAIDGYALAPPGVPVLLSPKSVLVITANVWDDAAQKKLNAEGKQMVIFEGTSGKTIIGSGLTRSKEEQMQLLSFNAAKAVQEWLLENPEWFGLPPGSGKKSGTSTVVDPSTLAAGTVPGTSGATAGATAGATGGGSVTSLFPTTAASTPTTTTP